MFSPVYKLLLPLFAALFVYSDFDANCPFQKCDCYAAIIHCGYSEFKKMPPLHAVNVTQPLALVLAGNSLSVIPAGSLPSLLTSIDFQGNPIKTIDRNAFNGSADTLTELMFDNSLFTELPDALLSLNNLTHLEISDMKITSWADNIMKHIGPTLQTLSLTKVGLTSWPSWIDYMPHLGTLDLVGASMQIPDNGFDSQINTLYSLDLSIGTLTDVPSAVTKLTQLQSLTLDNNNISRITGLPSSPTMTSLSMDSNKLTDSVQLSDALLSASGSLAYLQLSGNQLTSVPDLSAMEKLQTVYITHNALSYIGNAEMPPSLVLLGLEGNYFKSIESFLRPAINLTTLMIPHNSIQEIHGENIPSSVTQLDLTFNLLTELTDDSFPTSSNMQSLALDSNPIAKISAKAFAGLSKLTYLSMSFTKITRLPITLTDLTSAVTIELGGNDDMICTCVEKVIGSWAQLLKVGILGMCGVTNIDTFINVLSVQCPD